MTGSLVVHDRPAVSARTRGTPCSARRSTTGGSWCIATCAASGTLLLLDDRQWAALHRGDRPRAAGRRRSPPSELGLALGRSRQAVKKVIMDQRQLAGVGNIYANEALFAAGIDPSKPARRLTPDEHGRLHRRSAASCGRRSPRAAPPSGTTAPAPASRATSSSSSWSTAARASPAVAAAPGSPARTRSTPASPSSATAASREPLAPDPARRPAAVDRPRPAPATGCARWRRTGPAVYRMTDASGRVHLRRQGQAAPDPAAHLFPRRVPGRQGGADPLCRERHRAGSTCPASSRPTWASCARSGRYRPYFNHRGNLTRRAVFIKVSGGPAPRVYRGRRPSARDDVALLRAFPVASAERWRRCAR